jgi:hypothetical protein
MAHTKKSASAAPNSLTLAQLRVSGKAVEAWSGGTHSLISTASKRRKRSAGGRRPSPQTAARDAKIVQDVLDLLDSRSRNPDRKVMVKEIEVDVAKRYSVGRSYLRRKLAEHRKKLGTDQNVRAARERELERQMKSPLFDEGEDELPAVLTIHGQTLTILDWAREANIHPRVLEARIRAGWDPEWALVPFPGMTFWEG